MCGCVCTVFFSYAGQLRFVFQSLCVQSWASYDLVPLCYNHNITITRGEDPIGEDRSGDGTSGGSIGEDFRGENSGGLRSRTVTRDLDL